MRILYDQGENPFWEKNPREVSDQGENPFLAKKKLEVAGCVGVDCRCLRSGEGVSTKSPRLEQRHQPSK